MLAPSPTLIQILETIPVACIVPHHDTYWHNKRFQEIYTRFIGDVTSAAPFVKALLKETNESFSLEYENRHFHIQRVLVEDSVVFYIEDKTEIILLETIRSDFIANLAHELRTPLTSIHGALETLREYGTEITSEQRDHFLQIAVRHTTRITEIFDNITLLSEIERGRAQLSVEEIYVPELIQDAILESSSAANAKGITFKKMLSLSKKCFGNPRLLTSALTNLVMNAIKHSQEKSQIVISAMTKEQNLHISVQDFGEGIPYEQQDRIFERFYRGDSGRDRHKGGSGLGLSLVKHIIKIHGGVIDVESKVGEGALFTITLPLKP